MPQVEKPNERCIVTAIPTVRVPPCSEKNSKKAEYPMQHPLTLAQVCAIAKCSGQTVYRRIKKNPNGTLFPRPHKIAATTAHGPRFVNRWEKAEVVEWMRINYPKLTPAPLEQKAPWYEAYDLVISAVLVGLLSAAAVAAVLFLQ
jgi:predicted DNA-binding transcriptional regulator AlpA